MDLPDDGGSPWGDEPSRSQNVSEVSSQEPESTTASQNLQASTTSSNPKSPSTRGGRTPRRYGTQKPRLEAVDDSLGPLGPLGDSFLAPPQPEQPPAPPQKEQNPPPRVVRPPTVPSQTSSLRGMMESVNLDDDDEAPSPAGPRIPPPVQPPAHDVPRRQTQPSVSVEQAAKPTFDISVGDPHKVGDLTSSHTVYQVRTKTSSKAYRMPEFEVARRYRDFLWLFNQLHTNNPGVVVPPPPEKQAVGRFDTEFVESRRAALERMLNKTAAHPILQYDADLKLFLESDAFNLDIKHKERKDPGLGESKGIMSSIGISVGSGAKFIEHDDWFHDRKIYLDALETQLKALLKSTDTVVQQRKGLAEACGDFSASLRSLAAVELSPSLSGPLDGLSDLQLRIKELYDRQAQQDVLTIGIVIDEYIRLIGSIKTAFAQRQKAYHSWHAAESELQKRKATQDKLLRQGRSQQDRLNALSADAADAERRVHQARLLFEDMGRLMRAELDRFEREKVEDFKSGIETFLESAVEAQKELIELWETYLMQLDAEDEGASFDSKAAAGVVAAPTANTAATASTTSTAVDPDVGSESTATDRPESQGELEGSSKSTPTAATAAANVTDEVEP